jgi:TolB-like protein/Tfp pilus assembly protein PilF
VRFAFGDHVVDVDRRELRRGAERIALEPQVFDLLVYLVQNRDRVVSRDDLLAAVWDGRIVSESTVTSRINAVRKAIGDSGAAQHLIRTVPRKGIRFVGIVRNEPEPAMSVDAGLVAADMTRPVLALLDKPSIAVLPFVNMSGDPEQEYFADGMVEEIITALSRIGGLFVIARNASFTYKGRTVSVKEVGRELGVRYVVEGSVRKAGQRVRIAAQLIDASTDAHLWADHFDGSLQDVFEIQDKVALSIAGAIEPTLQAAEIRRSTQRPTKDLTTYDLYLQALSDFPTCDRDRIVQGLASLEQAIAREPRYAPALALAAVYRVEFENHNWADDPEANRSIAIEFSRRALATGSDDAGVLGRAAVALGRFGAEIDTAIALIDRALALNPSFADGWYMSGWLRLFAGQPDLAIEHFEASIRLNPRDRRGFHLSGIGTAYLINGRFDDAAAALRVSLEELPSFTPTYQMLASCYAHMGRLDEARAIVQRLRLLTPSVVPTIQLFRDPAHVEFFLSGLRLAAGQAA